MQNSPIQPLVDKFMNHNSSSPARLSPWLLAGAIATTVLAWTISANGPQLAAAMFENSPKTVVDEVWQIVYREYMDPAFNQVDWRAVRYDLLSHDYTSREQAYAAIREALKSLDDPYTRFSDPEQYQALTTQTAGELSGVGIRLGLEEETQILIIVELIDQSPAAVAQLQAGDRILAIDGQSTQGMAVERASALIRGDVGASVTLSIVRQGQHPFEISLIRDQFELPSVHYTLDQDGPAPIGYIRIDEFTAHAPEQVQAAIQDLTAQAAAGYILDLRGNPGGLLYAGVDIARMWLEDGKILYMVDRGGEEEHVFANRSALTQLPLVVLVNQSSASASEILAGALKDNNRATIVGTRTFGKAVVQRLFPLSDGSGITVTTSRYYPPSGVDINHQGIVPDIEMDLTRTEQARLLTQPSLLATADDPQYMQALSVLETMTVTNS